MNKRERLEKTIAGEATDRVPVALWQHWPGDDQRAADLAQATLTFQQQYDWDFLVVMPSNNFSTTGYGVQDQWQGNHFGERDIIKTAVHRSLDWTELRPIDPIRGDMGKQLECLRLLGHAFAEDAVPFVQVVYNPLTQALRLAGRDMLLRTMRQQPDRLRTGLNTITETTLRFVEALRRNTAIAGLFYIVELADFTLLSEAEYHSFGYPYDRKIYDSIARNWWLNILQIRGAAPMLHRFSDYPMQVFNWSDQNGHPALASARTTFKGALCGGLAASAHLHFGTPAIIRDAARKIINDMGQRRLILSAGRSLPISTPRSNLQAARDVVNTTVM